MASLDTTELKFLEECSEYNKNYYSYSYDYFNPTSYTINTYRDYNGDYSTTNPFITVNNTATIRDVSYSVTFI